MRKGNKAVVRAGAELWRDASSDDRSAWRAALDAEAAERRARGEEVW